MILLKDAMSDPDIRLLLDESILGFKKVFRDKPGYDVLTCLEAGHPRGTKDAILIESAFADHRFFLTNDFDTITPELYPPCKRASILRLPRNKISREYVFERVNAIQFLRLAHRAVTHFTFLEDDKIEVVTHNETIERKFTEYEETKHIT